VSSASIAARRVGTAPARRPVREWLTFAAFVGPNLALLAIFAYWPLVQNVALSFTEWDMISPTKRFVGLDN
jgi:ABC-type sugar transport system permease subunit